MKYLISITIIFLLLSCADDNGEDKTIEEFDPNKPVDFVISESDILGKWHLTYLKHIHNSIINEFDLNDTIDFKENNVAYWYGISNEDYQNYSVNFYTEDAEWTFDSTIKKIVFYGRYSLEKHNGIPNSWLDSEIWGYISKFDNEEMILTYEHEDEEWGYFYSESRYTKIP